MESWSYVYGGKDFLSDDSLSANGGISRTSKNGLMGCELKSPWSYGSTMMCSSQQECVVNQHFADMGSSDMMKTTLPNNSIGHIFVDDESSSRLSTSVVESNCRDSSLIDLKLGRRNDYRDVKNFSSLKANSNSSSADSSIPAKRARGGSFSSQIPYCQVHGCKKDLSSCKDYHKRHKVCEIHSKTAKVIVNGIEQRFCQQCSRFHLLGEFDDGKRSCRKRLAGHNERRRKPHLRVQADRSGRLFQSFNATRFQGNSFSASSFICQDTSYMMHDSSRIVKVEDGVDLSSRLSNPFMNGLVQPKSLFGSHDSEKQSPSLHDDGFSIITRSKINENNSFLQDIADSHFVSRSIFHNSSIANEDMRVSDSSSNIQSHSHRALSLLSSRIPTTLPLITSGSRALYTLTSENPFGVGSQIPPPMNPMEENHLHPILISNGNAPVNNGIDGIIHDSQYTNRKNNLSCEDNPTINLLELSLQMQRVEKQRQSMQMTQEDDAFSDLKIT